MIRGAFRPRVLVSCACLAAAAVPAIVPADGTHGLYESVTFTKGEQVVRGLFRHAGNERSSLIELLLEAEDGRLVKVEERMWLEPVLGGRTRVSLEAPSWWIAVETSYPNFKASSFREAATRLKAGEAVVLSVATSEASIGSGEFTVAADQNRGTIQSLSQIADEGRVHEIVPAGAVDLLVLLEDIVGPHGGPPQEWSFNVGWRVTGFVGPVLRGAGGAAGGGWSTATEPNVGGESPRPADLELLRRAEAAGLVDRL